MGQQEQKKPLHKKQWPKRDSLIPGKTNVLNMLVNPEKVVLPP
jgi:hypothetical protein